MFSARVSGSVQGVGFRACVHTEATRLGLDGHVRNLANGPIKGLASGHQDALNKLLSQLENGPPEATVESVTVERSGAEITRLSDPVGIDIWFRAFRRYFLTRIGAILYAFSLSTSLMSSSSDRSFM
ncbi:MAG: acylphosphatase [Dehalococcoidia bacterium]|nr:acylphosphatase [Dehalococcoidia bacterium]